MPRSRAWRHPSAKKLSRRLKIIGLLALGSLPTFIIVVVLGVFAITFTVTGIGVMLAGAADQAGALPAWINNDLEPWFAIVVGALLTVAGIISGWVLAVYMRFVVRDESASTHVKTWAQCNTALQGQWRSGPTL